MLHMNIEELNTYTPETVPASVPLETRALIGRALVEAGFSLVSGYATSPDNPMTVRTMLSEMDAIACYERKVHTPNGIVPTVVGPYYTLVDGKEFCFTGLGVWRPPINEQKQ